jgi:exosome complex RNA-binding protein Rrp42 (RNase PH superfamily)
MADFTQDNKDHDQLRRQIRNYIKEAMEDPAASAVEATPPTPELNTSVLDPNDPERHTAKGGLTVTTKPDMSLQSTIVEIAKSAAYGMERIELLKKRDFPTHKSANAVGTAIDALEMIFKDMLRNPMNYLDEDPAEKVAEYEQSLDDEASKLGKA